MSHEPKDRIDEWLDELIHKDLIQFSKNLLASLKGKRSDSSSGLPPKSSDGFPNTLYKYVGWDEKSFGDVASGVLGRRTIRYTHYSNLNDPFELNPVTETGLDPRIVQKFLTVRKIRKYLWRLVLGKPFSRPANLFVIPFVPFLARRVYGRIPFHVELATEAYENVRPKMFDKLGHFFIACFSEDPLQPLMWAHYTRAHTGIVVGYDAGHPYFVRQQGSSRLAPVVYSDVRPWLGFSKDFALNMGRRKSLHWNYEREWRVIAANPSLGEKVVDEVVPKNCITDVYLGLRIPSDQRTRLLAMIAKDLTHVKVHELQLDGYKYVLEAKPVIDFNP